MTMYAGIAMTALALGSVLLTVATGTLRIEQDGSDQDRDQITLAEDGPFDAVNPLRMTA
ncbi:hypothetical protein TL08_26680 [Actinoalloteichus hymeniacidonis]|uniref:DUF2613 family protein n=2 Tax=Actinoalloteichus hymeniacidonis TaxID=340345 RepID=A0AAC9N0Y8_9PSEU|nr:hypothetical protein TL08_26680 [Actinoalloteichus hymeniacidonis]